MKSVALAMCPGLDVAKITKKALLSPKYLTLCTAIPKLHAAVPERI